MPIRIGNANSNFTTANVLQLLHGECSVIRACFSKRLGAAYAEISEQNKEQELVNTYDNIYYANRNLKFDIVVSAAFENVFRTVASRGGDTFVV